MCDLIKEELLALVRYSGDGGSHEARDEHGSQQSEGRHEREHEGVVERLCISGAGEEAAASWEDKVQHT